MEDAELDWPNIAEEIEDVGRSEFHAVESLLVQAFCHRLKAEEVAGGPLMSRLGEADAINFLRQARRNFSAVLAPEDRHSQPLRRRAGLDAADDGRPGTEVVATWLPVQFIG